MSQKLPARSETAPPPPAVPAPAGDEGDLPEGWAVAKLAEIGSWCSGGTPSRTKPEFFGKGIPWVKSGDLPDGPIAKTDEQITQAGLDNSAAKLMPAGTICMALYGATIGKLGVMTFPAATNQATANLVPDDRLVERQFVFQYLMSERERFIDLGQGGAQPNISQEIVRNHPITLPPLAEQRRIVGVLEGLLGKVAASRERLARVPQLLKRFRQSVLAAACSGKLTNDWREENGRLTEDFESVALSKIVSHLEQGWSPKCEIESSESDQDWAVIKTTAIQHLKFQPEENKRLPDTLQPRADLQIQPGDILITRAGPRVRAGVTCYVHSVRSKLILCDKAYRVRVLETLADPEFIALVLNTPDTLEELDAMKTGTSESGMNLTQQKFLCLEVPFPPLAEQHEIVRRVEQLFALADRLEAQLDAARKRVDRLTQSILAKAFRGELVPTEADLARREARPYEPAHELLARIRDQQTTTKPTKAPRKPRKATRE